MSESKTTMKHYYLGVPLLRQKQCFPRSFHGTASCEAVAHCHETSSRGEKCGLVLFCLAPLLISLTPGSWAAQVESVMDTDPHFELPGEVPVFSPKLKPLWLEALAQPEADLKRRVAETIADAHRRGMPDLADTAGPLAKTLDTPNQHPIVKLSCVRAIVQLDARQAAPVLYRHAASDRFDMAQLVEPALVRWDYKPMRAVWLARLEEPGTGAAEKGTRFNLPERPEGCFAQIKPGPFFGPLVLAIHGLAAVKEKKACPHLARFALDPNVAPDIRMESARALGLLKPAGSEADARRLSADKSPGKIVDRLVAAWLVAHHGGPAAEKLFLEMAVDPEPSVAAIALGRLLEIDPMLIQPLNRRTMASPDAKVRKLTARALFGQRTPEAVELLGIMLDDPHPGVRTYAQESLAELASDAKLDSLVRAATMKMLGTDRRHGLEQAALVLGAFDHEPAADRLVELLEFEDSKVYVTAAWALCRLQVPATADAMFDKVRRETEATLALAAKLKEAYAKDPMAFVEIPPLRHKYDQLSHLIQGLGLLRYSKADALFRLYLPKPPMPALTDPPVVEKTKQAELRAAAVWAFGHIYANSKPTEGLTTIFRGRLSDMDIVNSESAKVRRMAAVSLGRINDKQSLPVLRKFYKSAPTYTMLGDACAWAIEKITGKAVPKLEAEPRKIIQRGWFLEPIEY